MLELSAQKLFYLFIRMKKSTSKTLDVVSIQAKTFKLKACLKYANDILIIDSLSQCIVRHSIFLAQPPVFSSSPHYLPLLTGGIYIALLRFRVQNLHSEVLSYSLDHPIKYRNASITCSLFPHMYKTAHPTQYMHLKRRDIFDNVQNLFKKLKNRYTRNNGNDAGEEGGCEPVYESLTIRNLHLYIFSLRIVCFFFPSLYVPFLFCRTPWNLSSFFLVPSK